MEEQSEAGVKRKVEDNGEGPANKKARVEQRPDHWKKFELENDSFEQYYKVSFFFL